MLPLVVAVPFGGLLTATTVSGLLSTSSSLASTNTSSGVSSAVSAVSSTAVGASFTGLTVTVTRAVSVKLPSLMV